MANSKEKRKNPSSSSVFRSVEISVPSPSSPSHDVIPFFILLAHVFGVVSSRAGVVTSVTESGVLPPAALAYIKTQAGGVGLKVHCL